MSSDRLKMSCFFKNFAELLLDLVGYLKMKICSALFTCCTRQQMILLVFWFVSVDWRIKPEEVDILDCKVPIKSGKLQTAHQSMRCCYTFNAYILYKYAIIANNLLLHEMICIAYA
jgi:hypothetical protein